MESTILGLFEHDRRATTNLGLLVATMGPNAELAIKFSTVQEVRDLSDPVVGGLSRGAFKPGRRAV